MVSIHRIRKFIFTIIAMVVALVGMCLVWISLPSSDDPMTTSRSTFDVLFFRHMTWDDMSVTTYPMGLAIIFYCLTLIFFIHTSSMQKRKRLFYISWLSIIGTGFAIACLIFSLRYQISQP